MVKKSESNKKVENNIDDSSVAILVQLDKDDILIKEGEKSRCMYWVQDGELAILKRQGDTEILLGHVYPGELVGEMSFLDNGPRCATVKAISKCELVEIQSDKYDGFFAKQPRWMQVLIKTLIERLRKANARIRI